MVKQNYIFVFVGFVFGEGDNFENGSYDERRGRQYMPILKQNNPSSSRWSENLHSVRESKLDNLFTYLSFRKDGPPDDFVVKHFVAAWGVMSCITSRCLEPSFQFMHDHDDLQWLSHGACMVTSS